MFGAFALVVLLLAAGLIIARSIRITQEWRRAVVLRLGRFHAVKGPACICCGRSTRWRQ